MKIQGVDNFIVEEFLHPKVFSYCNQSDGFERWRWYISPFMMDYATLLRELSGAPIIINNWHRGGRYVGRGHRPSYYKPKGGSDLSMHYHSKALDVSSKRYTPLQLFELINDHRIEFEAIGLTTIENPRITKTWLHGDSRQKVKGIHPATGFLVFDP